MRHFPEITIELFPPDAGNQLRLRFVSGLFATTLVGGSVMPWIVALMKCLFSHLLSHGHSPLPLPNPLDFLLSPNWITGAIWLLYYLVSAAGCRTSVASLIHNRLLHLGIPLSFAPGEHLGLSLYHALQRQRQQANAFSLSYPLAKPQTLPLSQVWKGETKHELLKRCYEVYRQALARYQPPLFVLQIPDTLYYHANTSLGYEGIFPVVPEALLTEERREELLPVLAHHLYWYHLQAKHTDFPAHVPTIGPMRWFLLLTGNFLWLPAEYGDHLLDTCMQRLIIQQTTAILEADAFAVLLGQGPALEHQLRLRRTEMKERGLRDSNTPTLAERLGRLEVLNKHERQQVCYLLSKVQNDKSFRSGSLQ